MPRLGDLIQRFRQSEFGQGLFNSPDVQTPVDAQQLEPSVMRQLGGRLRRQYEALAGPGSPWSQGDIPGMVSQAAQTLNPINTEAIYQAGLTGSPSRTLISEIPYLGPAINEMIDAQAGGRPNEATAVGLEQLLNVLAMKGVEGAPGAARGVARGVRAVGDLPTVDVTGAPVTMRQLLASEHGMVPIGVEPWRGTPETAIRSARKPTEAFEARAGRLAKRKAEIGAPKNERTVLKDPNGKDFVVGKNTAQDQMDLIQNYHKDDADIWDSATWYEQMSDGLAEHFDAEAVDPYKLAFATTQAANSPVAGIRDILTAERLKAGHPEPAQPASGARAMEEIFSNRPPTSGVGQKVSEFIDNLFNKRTRTQMNDDPRWGAPATADRHDFRAQGYVDPAYKLWLDENTGPAAESIKIDTPSMDPQYSGRVTEAQFENLVRNRNEQVDAFNAAKFAGHDDWNTNRIQAAAWAAKKTQMGGTKVPVSDLFKAYYSHSPMELSWGTNSPYSTFFPSLYDLPWETNVKITGEVLPKLAAAVGERVGVRVIKTEPVAGTFFDTEAGRAYINPNTEFTIFGTEKARQDWVEAMGHAANQTATIAYHLLPAGEGSAGIYDLHAQSPFAVAHLADRVNVAKYIEALQAKNPKFNGAEFLSVEGKPTLRIAKVTSEYKPDGHFTPQEVAELDAAAHAVAQDLGPSFETRSTVRGADIQSSFNDWGTHKNGEAHTSNFSAEGRQHIISWLEGPLREQFAGWTQDAFRKHSPKTWDKHFAAPTKSTAAEPAGAGAAAIAEAPVKAQFPYNKKALGNGSSAENFNRGWILPNGDFIQVPAGGTHETSLMAATGIDQATAAAQYPAYAAKAEMIRAVSHLRKQGNQLIVEIFKPPTDAQLRALLEWQKANSLDPLYDNLYFALTDPKTNQTIFQGTDLRSIRRAIKDTNFDVPF